MSATVAVFCLIGTAISYAEQCPAGSGKYCPAGTYCGDDGKCYKEDYSRVPPVIPGSVAPKN